jgi:hypothetical protein
MQRDTTATATTVAVPTNHSPLPYTTHSAQQGGPCTGYATGHNSHCHYRSCTNQPSIPSVHNTQRAARRPVHGRGRLRYSGNWTSSWGYCPRKRPRTTLLRPRPPPPPPPPPPLLLLCRAGGRSVPVVLVGRAERKTGSWIKGWGVARHSGGRGVN